MIHVLKADGEREPYSEEKVIQSIHRARIPKDLQTYVIKHVEEKLYDNIPSLEIYHHITEFLKTSPQPFTKSRYSLKQAIMELGPTGYPFEDYVAKILSREGFYTKTRQTIQGSCITHEIDVVAEKNTVLPNKIMIEVKFHNIVGLRTNVHVPMYTKARFDDVKDRHGFKEVWIVTNTKATIDAMAYAGCVGMKMITWSYPDGESLRELVEKYHLYPITTLTSLDSQQKQQLLLKGTVLCRDICENNTLLNSLQLTPDKKVAVIDEVSFVCESTG